MTRFRMLLAATCACVPFLQASLPASAQPFPSRPVTLLVPFAAGGPSDALGRVIAQAMTGPLGQQVVVENVGGAGGTLGGAKVAAARPDGHTMLLASIGQATSVTLYRKLPFHPVESFETVGMVGEVPMTIVGRRATRSPSAMPAWVPRPTCAGCCSCRACRPR